MSNFVWLGSVLERRLFAISGHEITVSGFLTFLLVSILTLLVSRWVGRLLARVFASSGHGKERGAAVFSALGRYAIMVIGFGVALDALGIDLGNLFTASAIFAVGIGFAMQGIAQNFISGLILLFERSVSVGDVLEIEKRVVRVEEMGIRATIVRTWDDEHVIIPNSILVQGTVINYTLRDSHYRLKAQVGVAYASDIDVVRRSLLNAATDAPWRLKSKEPRVELVGFGSSSIDFEVWVWIHDPWEARGRLSQLNQAIWRSLKLAEVTVAFPQLDLHVDQTLLSRLGARSQG